MDHNKKKPSGDYSVGYCRPPEGSRFKPGGNPNPRGRPKGSAKPESLLQRELRKKVTITENGQKKQVTKAEIIKMRLINMAMEGNMPAIKEVMRLQSELNFPNELKAENALLREKIVKLQKELVTLREQKSGGVLMVPMQSVNNLEFMMTYATEPHEVWKYAQEHPEEFLEMVRLKSRVIPKPSQPSEEANQTDLH